MFENEFVEFKREYTPNICRTIIAFANCNGGSLYIGIEDDGNVVGVDNADDVMLRIVSNIRDNIVPDVSLLSNVEIISSDGKTVVHVEVMRGTARPYSLKGKGIRPEGVFVRCGSATVPASRDAILKMIKESSGYRYETEISVNQDLTFHYAENIFDKFEIGLDDRSMRNYGAINENGMYTNLALLMSDQCPHIIKLAVFQGEDVRVFRDRAIADGSILKQLDYAVDYIGKYNRLRAEIVGLYRRESYDYSLACVRELLLNALIHRDYAYDSPILVSIFSDKISIVNIGGLYGGISADEIGVGISSCRNKNLAELMYRLKLIEAFGTGIMRVKAEYAESVRQPEFIPGENSFRVTLPNQNYEKEYEYNNYVSENSRIPTYDAISRRGQQIIQLVKDRGSIVRPDIENDLGVSQATAILVLRELVEKGILNKVGAGKQTRYELKK